VGKACVMGDGERDGMGWDAATAMAMADMCDFGLASGELPSARVLGSWAGSSARKTGKHCSGWLIGGHPWVLDRSSRLRGGDQSADSVSR